MPIEPALSWLDRLIAATAGVAHARIVDGTGKQAVISPDGSRLYVVGWQTGITGTENEMSYSKTSLGLKVVDTATGREIAAMETEASQAALSADGQRLYLSGWRGEMPWTDVLDTKTLPVSSPILASPSLRTMGFFCVILSRMKLKNAKALARMRASGRMVAECFALLKENIQPGVSLSLLDQLVESYIREQGAEPLYKGYRGSQANHPPFPGVICASVNHEVCHGLPNDRILQEGDIVGIDIGLKYKGWCGDACVTFPVGQVSPRAQRLLDVAERCLWVGIEAAKSGGYLNDVGRAIHDYADSEGVSVVREWGGHGIGRSLHEAPSVSHIRQPERGPKLRPGMTFTIEPMINEGTSEWILLNDGWTVITADGKLSAQFEHTVAITRNGPEILTLP